MADLTGISFGVAGVTQATNFTKSYAYVVDFADQTTAGAVGSNDLFVIPAGEVVTGIKTVPLASATAGGNMNFYFKVGTNSVDLGTATTVTSFGTATQVIAGGGGYSDSAAGVVGVKVATTDVTGLKMLVEVDTLPAKEFVTKG